MKKALAILMAALMVLSLFACAPKDDSTSSPSAEPNTSAPATDGGNPTAGATGDVEIGYYNPNYDYSANPTYKVVYMMQQAGSLYDAFDKAFEAWAQKANVDYTSFNANNDNDLFLTTIETYAAQGYNGYLLDADSTIYPAVNDLMNELELPWMTCMAAATDSDGNRVHPVVGFNNIGFGESMANYVIEYQKANWPDASVDEIGMLSMNFSLSPQLNERTMGSRNVWLEEGFKEENFFEADGASTGSFNAQGGFDLAAAEFSSNPNIKYWLICAFFDDYADGAVRAAEQAGIADNSVATTCGGTGLIAHWDAGEADSAWKSAIFCAQTLFAEPIFFGLYAFMNGDATPETIFPKWIDTANGETYAYVDLPSFTIERDNYKEYMEWVDSVTDINWSPYDDEYQGTEYNADVTPSF